MDLKSRIKKRALEIWDEVIGNRRHIHMNPELSYFEHNTMKYVQARLEEMGIEVQPHIGETKTGLVGYIYGKPGGPTIALRADMDALPILEANDIPYKSKNEGVMHACGHDAHTSSLLGTAKILQELREEFTGTIKLFFQPAEERSPGGAEMMIADGVLENPKVQSIFGQHVHPQIEAGKIAVRSGLFMASADEIHITVKGKGGHAAHPMTLIDPVMITAQMLVSLQQVVSRMADPRIPTVLSFGKVEAKGVTNIIPNEVHLEGTFRTFDEKWRFEAHKRIKEVATSVVEMYGGTIDIEVRVGHPFVYNNEDLTARARKSIEAYVGAENVLDLPLWMGAEDFAHYSHKVPGCYYRLGTRSGSEGAILGLHTPTFNIDEDALKLSTGLMAWIALQELKMLIADGQVGETEGVLV